jgi:hypothetical protein
VCVTGRVATGTCAYAQCTADDDCGSEDVCECAANNRPNTCLSGTCRNDSDCGEGGYCSPSPGTCGPDYGTAGYFCHKACAGDECVNDSDCAGDGGSFPAGYCAWDPTQSKWACNTGFCSG